MNKLHAPQLTLLTLCVAAALNAQAQSQSEAAVPSDVTTQLETVTVTGQAGSLRKSLALQKKAQHVLSAISADDIGALPDKNAAEALARLPGLAVQRDQGEGRFVVIRGLGADLNSVTLNGALVPAPEASRRGVALDTLPAGMVRSLEVSKSLTPDRDANSMGGTVEVKTLSAYDLPTEQLNGQLGVNWDGNTGHYSPSANALWARRFDDGKFGLALGLATEKRHFGSDNAETGGAWNNGRLSGFEMREYQPTRERHALSANLEARPAQTESYFLRGFVSRFSDDEVRDRMTIGSVANSTATPGGSFVEGQTVTARAERRLRQRKYTQEIASLSAGGERQWQNWTLQAALGASRASEDTPEAINDARFRQNNVAGVSFIDTRAPHLDNPPAALFNPAGYALNAITLQARDSQDREHHGKFDLSHHWSEALDFKFGAKASRRSKSNDTEQWSYTSSNAASPAYWGAGPTTLAGFTNGHELDYALNRLGPAIDPNLVRERVAGLARDPARLLRESIAADYRMHEDIDAGYVQGSLDLTPSWNVLAGMRVERTDFSADGMQISASGALQPVHRERRSHQWLPGLHSRYDLGANTSLRAALWNSLVRANFSQLAPAVNLTSATEATIGNPDLRPLRARNLDLGLEHHLGQDGLLSAYLFHKDIKDFTYTTNLAGTGLWTGYTTATSYANGDSASVKGVELAYMQRLKSLPGMLSGLIVGANATFSKSSAHLSRFDKPSNGTVARDIRLPGQSNALVNLMLGYEQGPISPRVAVNHKSAYLLELGPDLMNASQERWVDRQRQIDFSVSYQINRQFQVQLEALNLNNEVYYVYQGTRPFNTTYEQYGRSVKLSLKVSAF